MIYKGTVKPELIKVAQKPCSIEILNSFRIVGGTGIALQIGHRISIDIDFFSNEKIGKSIIANSIKENFPEVELTVSTYNVKATINGIRVEIFDDWGTPYRQPPVIEENMRIASLQDIAALKLTALTERRQKKDYIDLYFLFKKFDSLALLIDYKNYEPALSDKSLLFALDEVKTAETNKSEMPMMIAEVSWDDIKKEMYTASKKFTSYLKLKM